MHLVSEAMMREAMRFTCPATCIFREGKHNLFVAPLPFFCLFVFAFFVHSLAVTAVYLESVYKEVHAVWVFLKSSVEDLFSLVMYLVTCVSKARMW